ncbi:MAG: hypothetical protein H6557_15300 [Lewinellaceae bacterium]|nr:hypothetical protein [Phaeodactylibacter sp.]MCB9037981.1 hypothetical protein [Lewinellaceae bacterium]
MKPTLQNLLTVAAFIFISFSGLAQSSYTYLLDLNKTEDGLLSIRLNTPAIEQEEIDFIFPLAVPGYYSAGLQFGTMVAALTAYDKWDMPLPAERVKPNQWRIQDAKRLHRIEYQVRNIWKYRLQNSVFLPVENFFIKDRAFMLNPGGLFGYVEGMENLPFYVYIVRPRGLFACSGINGMPVEGYKDAFSFPSYQELAGYPILYSDQRPASFQVANTAVQIGVFSENKMVSPERIQKIYEPILAKLAHYMGDTLPTDKYAFLFFFYDGDIVTQAAMEHGNSSAFVWPEQWDAKRLKSPSLEEGLERVDLHKFLHIYAPLNIHSEEAMQFDFDEPQTSGSRHQWLYQGTTEYLFYHARVNQGMIPEKNFFWFVNDFLGGMKDFRNDVSLTEVSLRSYGSLNDQSSNLQLKGVVASLLLDIELRALSGGKYSVKQLVKDLAARYGRYKSFKDEDLFEIIAEMTYPEIGEFLLAHVGGTKPMPINEVFGKVGMEYDAGDNKVYPKLEPSEEELTLRKVWLYGE